MRTQVDPAVFEIVSTVTTSLDDWMGDHLQADQVIGYDPWLHTPSQITRLTKVAERVGARLEAVASNPIDAIWDDQPEPPAVRAWVHPHALAGRTSEDKRKSVAGELEAGNLDAAVITQPDSVAWLLNIRGGDVAHTPVALSYAILHKDGHASVFMDERKVGEDVRTALGNGVSFHAPDALGAALDDLGQQGRQVRIDPAFMPVWIARRLEDAGAKTMPGADPCQIAKARKTPAEIEGTRTAHRRDGVAISRFLAWLDREGPAGGLDEIAAVRQLEQFREGTGALKDISFETISASGPNGALAHYRVTETTNRPLEPGSLYLVDSGGQYEDGTTDITRTVVIGTPTEEMRDRFTRVLKGMILLSRTRFPEKTRGVQLDALARWALWQGGFDYDHGTGHGVGSFLGVHEGPQSISKVLKDQVLVEGMILSNEPGYYRENAFGIRTENLIVVTAPEVPPGGDRPMYGFETLTLAPIDRRLIVPDMLSDAERGWLDGYHARVRTEIGPALEGADRDWLEEATAPLV